MSEKIPSEIRKIVLNDASFKGTNAEIDLLTFVNFFFGNNGCGKTTIAQAIKNGVGITYAPGKSVGDYIVLIYDERFIERNFSSYKNMPGVFTINETNQTIQEEIDKKTEEQEALKRAKANASDEKLKKEKARTELISNFQRNCWKKSESLREEFEKTQEKKKKSQLFTDAVLTAQPIAQDLDKLRRLYDSAYSDTAKKYDTFSEIEDVNALDNLEGNDILSLSIVNSADTNYAKFIRKIGATEWAHLGHEQYSENAEGNCPYCGRPLNEEFEETFIASFDTQYQDNLNKLKDFRDNYKNTANTLFPPLKAPQDLYPKINAKAYNEKLDELKTVIQLNLEEIANKIESPAIKLTLKETAPILQELSGLITSYNKLIEDNNAIVSSRPKKQQECTNNVFSHIAYLFKDAIAEFRKSRVDLDKEINAWTKEINDCGAKLADLKVELANLRSQTVETDSAKDKINLMLRDSGLHGFRLEPHDDKPHVYKVVRPDNTIADNLSEGEKNFIAFLYFYYLVQGSETADGDDREKIVVIDDPVSSMDINSLFIVSTLVKDMIEVCRNNADNENAVSSHNFIKQIFILTHNAFFHQEITYSYIPRYDYTSFYLVRKPYGESSVRRCYEQNPQEPSEFVNINPVKNSYAALWEEYKEIKSAVPLMNVIRKILEYYFLQLCGYEGLTLRKVILKDNKDKFIKDNGEFDEEKYMIASSMLSYISAGSVGISDAMYHVDDYMDIEECRKIFAMIFNVMQQEQHYIKMCEPYKKRNAGRA